MPTPMARYRRAVYRLTVLLRLSNSMLVSNMMCLLQHSRGGNRESRGLFGAKFWCWVLSMTIVLGSRVAAESQEPLDRALRLLSAGTAIGNKVRERPSKPDDHLAWDREMAELKDPPDTAIAAAAASAEAITAKRDAIRAIQQLADEKNAPLFEKAAAENLMSEMLSDLGARPSPSAIEAEVSRGRLSRSDADAILAAEELRRGRLQRGQLAFFEALYNQEVASVEKKRLELQAEVLEGRIVAEHLVPALRARAGNDTPPACDVFVGGKSAPQAHFPTQGYAYISLRSHADYELTRLTLLVKLNLPLGSRYACAFVERLPPRGQLRLAPVNYAVLYRAAENSVDAAPSSMAGYSLWCDQFSLEDQKPTPNRSARLEYSMAAIAPETMYVDRSQLPSTRGAKSPTSVKFTELELVDGEYRVVAEIALPDPKKPGQVTVNTFTGTAKAVKDKPQNAAALISLRSKETTYDLATYIQSNGELTLAGLGSNSPLRNLVPQADVDQLTTAQRDFRSLNDQLVAARKLIMTGQRDEAQRLIEKFMASAPGEKWETEAREILENMDRLEEQGKRLQQAQQDRMNSSSKLKGRSPLDKKRMEKPNNPPAKDPKKKK